MYNTCIIDCISYQDNGDRDQNSPLCFLTKCSAIVYTEQRCQNVIGQRTLLTLIFSGVNQPENQQTFIIKLMSFLDIIIIIAINPGS